MLGAILTVCLAAELPVSPEILLGPVRQGGGSFSRAGNGHVAFVGGSDPFYAVTWDDQLAPGAPQIRAARVSLQGQQLSSSGVGSIDVESGLGARSYPVVAALGSGFAVVWQETGGLDNQLGLRRFSATGAALGPRTLLGFSGANDGSPSVEAGAGASELLVVWNSNLSGLTRVHGSRVDPQGTLLDDAASPLLATGGDERFPTLGYDGVNWQVGWRRGNNTSCFARVSAVGQVIDPAGLTLASKSAFQSQPSIGCASGRCLMTWSDTSSGSSNISASFVSGAFVETDGGFFLTTAPGDEGESAVAFLGASWVVVWEDDRGDGGLGVWGREVFIDGGLGAEQLLSPVGVRPDLAADGQGHALLVYERLDAASSQVQLFARVVSATETVNVDAGTGGPGDGGADAGLDGGVDPGAPEARRYRVGCGCAAQPQQVLVLGLLGLLLARRRALRCGG